jgi:peroxiredoxin Q/BCP
MRMNEVQNLQVGALAEDFTLSDSTGTPRTLSSLLTDGSLLLIFYRGYWWPFCLRQLAEFRDLFDDFRGLGVRIAAVAVDSPEQSDRVRRQYELPFPILCDTQKQVVRTWGLFNAKEKDGMFIIQQGIIDKGTKASSLREYNSSETELLSKEGIKKVLEDIGII